MIETADLLAACTRLSGQERALVELLAVAFTPLPLAQADEALRGVGLGGPARRLAEPLVRNGLVRIGQHFRGLADGGFYSGKEAIILERPLVEVVARDLVAQGRFDALARAVQAAAPIPRVPYGAGFYFETVEQFLRFARITFYRGDFETLSAAFDFQLRYGSGLWLPAEGRVLDRALFFALICSNPFDRKWFLGLPAQVANMALPVLVRPAVVYWLPLDADVERVLADGCEGRLGRAVPAEWHVYRATLQWLRGDFGGCRRQLGAVEGTGLEGCLTLLAEGPGEAIADFEITLAGIAEYLGRGAGKPVLPRVQGALHMLALWLRGSASDARKAASFLKRWQKRTPDDVLRSVMSLVPGHLRHEAAARADLALNFMTLDDGWRDDPLGFTVAFLLAAWLDREVALEHAPVARECAALAARQGLAWPVAELTALLARLGAGDAGDAAIADAFERERSVTLLARRLPLVEPWERALESLIAVGAARQSAPEPPPAPGRAKRLAWIVSETQDPGSPLRFSLAVREQTRTASGWSPGKLLSPAALSQWSAAGKDVLLDQDHRAARHVVTDRHPYRPVFGQRAWLALVGHPHLVRAGSQEPLELAVGQIELHVVEQPGGDARITMAPDFTEDHEVVVWEDAPSRLRVTEITPELRLIRGALGQEGLTVPRSGREKVLDALGAVASLVAVHSDIGGASATSVAVEADPAPRVLLSPEGEGLAVAFAVRPIGESGPAFPPGEGGKTVFIDSGGQRLDAARDLGAERERAGHLRAALASLDLALPAEKSRWSLPRPEDCLELLLELRDLPDPVPVEWPAGERFRLAGRADFSHLALRVASSGQDWFGVTGQLRVSEDLVVDMQRLLDLLALSKGRFVRLDDGRFLALTEAFRGRLGDLDALTDVHGKGRRVHTLAAELFEELAAAGCELSTWSSRMPSAPSTRRSGARSSPISTHRRALRASGASGSWLAS